MICVNVFMNRCHCSIVYVISNAISHQSTYTKCPWLNLTEHISINSIEQILIQLMPKELKKQQA